jgi:DNA primase
MREERADVQAIKDRVDILSIISRYLSLTKSGANYKGRCPFHKDDTPSFMVNPEKGLWHCFGCGEGGDIFSFLMKMEKIDFLEAAKRLAAEGGLTFGRKTGGEQKKLLTLNAEAASFFSKNLLESDAAEQARAYLLNRGYDEDIWRRYGLGYATPGWEHLKRAFSARYGEDDLLRLGLLVAGERGTYDRFRDRVIFTIYDLSGQPIAFGGRAFDGEPKYLNSPQTGLFDKGRQLYGISWAREALVAEKTAILVEGYTDVLSLHIADTTNVVGSMGTSLTEGQASLLARFVDEVIIAYDPDAAGGAASFRGMNILHRNNLAVRVARLPKGEDPDSLVRRENGVERWISTLEQALPFHLFFIETLKARHDLSSLAGKEDVLLEARAFYQNILSLPLKREVANQVAELLDLSPEAVIADLTRSARRRSPENVRSMKPRFGEEEVILWLLLNGEVEWTQVGRSASPEDFSPPHRPIVEALSAGHDPSEVTLYLDDEAKRRASSIALTEVVFTDSRKALKDALRKLVSLPKIKKKLAVLREEMKQSEETGDRARLDELQQAYHSLVTERLGGRGGDGKD